MKKTFITVILAAAIAISSMTACTITFGSDDTNNNQGTGTSEAAENSAPAENPAEASSAEPSGEVMSEASSSESSSESSNESSSSIANEIMGNGLSNDTSKTESSEQSSSSSANNSDVKISDDIRSFQISLDGEVYTMPCEISDFEKNGWTLKSADGNLGANEYTFGPYMEKGEKQIALYMVNLSDSEKKLSECPIGQVKVYAEDQTEVVLPGGLVFDESLTIDDIKAAYGEPDQKSEDDDYTTYTYKGDGWYQSIEFFIYKQGSDMAGRSWVYIKNFGK